MCFYSHKIIIIKNTNWGSRSKALVILMTIFCLSLLSTLNVQEVDNLFSGKFHVGLDLILFWRTLSLDTHFHVQILDSFRNHFQIDEISTGKVFLGLATRTLFYFLNCNRCLWDEMEISRC